MLLAQRLTMASLYLQTSSIVPASMALLLLFLMSLPAKIFAQNTPISPDPTLADCSTSLLPLTPCAPFVQGMAQSPPPTCCENLDQLSLQQPACVCLLLNQTNFASFPINTTLALQLPALCSLQLNSSSCPGFSGQVSLGARANSSSGIHSNSSIANSSIAVPPMIQVAPRPVIPIGFGRSTGFKLKAKTKALMVIWVTLLITLLA